MIDSWLRSGARVDMYGAIGLIPRVNPFSGWPVEISAGQATNYVLDDEIGRIWYLKRFLSGKRPSDDYIATLGRLIPRFASFRAGWSRSVVLSADVSVRGRSKGLEEWLDGTVLSPSADGDPWNTWLADLAGGEAEVSDAQRLDVARGLATHVALLEACSISHRDLSGGNVLINGTTTSVIDWDTMFHDDLAFQANTTVGSLGYMARWVGGRADASWRLHADRFALAVLIAEALTVDEGCTLHGDNSLFEQRTISQVSPPSETVDRLRTYRTGPADLFLRAWRAKDYSGCPSPVEWAIALGDPDVERAAGSIADALDAITSNSLDRAIAATAANPVATALPGWASDKLQKLKTSRAAIARALAEANVDALTLLMADGLIHASDLRPSLDLEVRQRIARDAAIADLSGAVDAKDAARARAARRRAYALGAPIPRALDHRLTRLSRGPRMTRSGARRRRTDKPWTLPPAASFDVNDIAGPMRPEPQPSALRAVLQQESSRPSWEPAAEAWFQLRALFPEDVTEEDREAGERARARWGAELNGRRG